MADTIDRLQVELETNVKEFLSEFEKAEKALNDSVKWFEQTERASYDLTKEIHKTCDEMEDLEEEVGRTSSSFDTMSDQTKEAAKEIDALSIGAIGSKGSLDELNGVLGAFGVTAGISSVIAAFQAIGDFAIESADKAAEAMEIIAFETGLAGEELQKYADLTKEIMSSTPYSSESIANTMATLETLNRDADSRTIQALATEWQAFLSMNPDASVEEFDRAFKKWGVSVEEQSGYLRAFNKIAQETGISMSALSSSLADGDRGYQMMGKNLIEAAAYLGEANYWGELDDAMALPDTLEKIQAQKAELLGSDEAAAKYVANVWAKAVELGDEGAIINYLKTVEGLGDNVARSIAASMSSSVAGTESAVNAASKAMETSLVDLDNQIQTTGDKWARIWNNMAIATEPVGKNLTEILDGLVDMSELWNTGNEGKLDVLGQLYRGYMAVTNPISLLPNAGRMLVEEGARQVTNHVNITQNISSPEPLNTARIEQATRRVANAAFKSVTNEY